ncbi:MAG: glutamate--tRNA ligase [Candidatus Eremiobacteraeota bacterium]|nr:glutamate--tRNA ligase [Candidatus Eremiobacteraeota bacterium]MCW5870430.1 glutamate--tRNA ligase [Candidatus Eremiobacteraeota bacterium]
MTRVRFAPSPTGYLHVGGLRTALYNYLLARRHGGKFLLRVEDTDQSRLVPDAVQNILDNLRWANIFPDEGAGCHPEGDHGPYVQSQRLPIYRKYADQLLESGQAYRCFASAEELAEMRQNHGGYDRRYRDYDVAEARRRAEAGEAHVIRMKVPLGESVDFEDLVRGQVRFDSAQVDDQVILKSDGFPTYHLAAVVDDHEMEISHVIRGEEWLTSTPKHLLLYRFFGWTPPRFAHLSLVVNLSGKKLSKRDGDVSVNEYREQGYLPAGLLNFLALLGWSNGDNREVWSLEEMEKVFALERVHPSPAVFDFDKLRHINQQHLFAMADEAIADLLPEWFRKAALAVPERAFLVRVVGLMKQRCTLLPDFVAGARYFYADPESYDEATAKKRWKPESAELVREFAAQLEDLPEWRSAELEAALRKFCEDKGQPAAALIHPVRLGISGVGGGPGLFEMLEVLGREICVRRLRKAAEVLR